MAKIKISELPTLAQQLQAANFVPVIHSGTTYKISLFNYLVKNSGDETIAGVKNFTSTPTVNSSPVRTDAIDSTIRSSISFTLPAMPDGARKRILNTHATNAITVTAYSGTTIEGQATMTLSAGHEVEIELIGSDWKKTGWNEKALLTYSAPVDCTSRVAEYTGDGIPLIPDNVAGAAFVRNKNWTDIPSGWQISGATASYANGVLRLTATSGYPQIFASSYSGYSGKQLVYRVRKISGSALLFKISSSGTIKVTPTGIGLSVYDSIILPSLSASLVLNFEVATAGDVYEIETIYIGTGAYDTPVLDRAGNGNSLTLNAVTPVNGKYCKEMSFNGSTSYAQASSPVIGTTGTVAIRFKRSELGTSQTLFDNRDASLRNGFGLVLDTSNNIIFIARDNTDVPIYNLGAAIGDITNYHVIIIAWNGTSIVSYIDNVASSRSQTTALSSLVTQLTIGRRGTSYFNGIVSHFRYDSHIWTADEARAWSLNPISIDSRV